jgi:raffinose/stachyose/melibiose transport system permease protein
LKFVRFLKKAGITIGLVAVSAVWLLPMWLTLVASLKSQEDYASTPVWAWPEHMNFGTFSWIINDGEIGSKIMNSLTIATGAAIIAVVMGFFIAYAISIGRLKYRGTVIAICIITFALPQESMAFPVFTFTKMIGVYGPIHPVYISLGILGSAFAAYLLQAVMNHFPKELVEAAHIDGAGKLQTMFRIVLPVMRPTVATVFLLMFVNAWNEYWFPILLLPERADQPLPMAIAEAFAQPSFTSNGIDPVLASAASIIAILPSVFIYLNFQKALVRGVTLGAN